MEDKKMYLERIEWKSVRCIYLAQDWDKWQSFVNVVINFHVP